MTNSKTITVRIPRDVYDKLVFLAEKENRYVSVQARWIIVQQLKRTGTPDEQPFKIFHISDYL